MIIREAKLLNATQEQYQAQDQAIRKYSRKGMAKQYLWAKGIWVARPKA
ncbi:hypothetical protein [Limnoraphis robusta]|uniref:Transposase n=1 Tax=Limnoraphis robusta CCNP1315 TaxID=3110306 RepID=A0ABU5TXU1_9CYAN|nr:hypothetical protein [Limnoraphis robusta]MEA5519303.1 hypothetical protein [Limnoraphis robusta CCNP1315]MEA5549045.1 hypothetical protein [Limnoraphis robusta CCNP1324]